MTTSSAIDRARRTGAWLAVAAVLSIILAVLGLGVGFGIGTTCTNAHPGGLDSPPCNVIDQAVKLNAVVQAIALALTLVALVRGRHLRVAAHTAIALSLTAFAVTMALAGSY